MALTKMERRTFLKEVRRLAREELGPRVLEVGYRNDDHDGEETINALAWDDETSDLLDTVLIDNVPESDWPGTGLVDLYCYFSGGDHEGELDCNAILVIKDNKPLAVIDQSGGDPEEKWARAEAMLRCS